MYGDSRSIPGKGQPETNTLGATQLWLTAHDMLKSPIPQTGCYYCGKVFGDAKFVHQIDRHMTKEHFKNLEKYWLLTPKNVKEFKSGIPLFACKAPKCKFHP